MGAFLARQPNGLLCRFSTVVDTVTDWNMTKDDYEVIRMCGGKKYVDDWLNMPGWVEPFSKVIDSWQPMNNTFEEFVEILREMGDDKTTVEDLKKMFVYDEQEEVWLKEYKYDGDY